MSDEYVSDPELLKKLNGGAEETKAPEEHHEYVTDPALLEKLNGTSEQQGPASDITPMPQFAGPSGPTGFSGSAVKKVAEPLVEAGKGVIGSYVKNPIQGIVDVGAVHMGLPPPYATTDAAKGLYNTYQAAKDSFNMGSRLASRFESAKDLSNVYHPLKEALDKVQPGMADKIKDAWQTGGNNAVNKILQSPEGQALASNPEAKIAMEKFAGAVPSGMQQAGKILGPVARGAAKVLGPAGLAMNAYDAAQYAQQANLGQRLAGGQGGIAQAAARNVQANAGSQYQLQPHEAANVLASGDQATINLYGGPQRLQQIAGGQSPSAPPTSNNFIERMKAMAHQYGTIR